MDNAALPFAIIGTRERAGWRSVESSGATLWISGLLIGRTDAALCAALAAAEASEVAGLLAGLDGFFALAFAGPRFGLAAVDHCASIQMLWHEDGRRTRVSPAGKALIAATGPLDIDADQACVAAMSGYTIGDGTLYRGVKCLKPGQFVLVDGAGTASVHRHYRYEPWRVEEQDDAEALRTCRDITLGIVEKTIAAAGGRQIAIPLSAGRDSRAIVSGLAELGHRNVVCFAYGLPGNREVGPSRDVARRLGYPWHYVPLPLAGQRAHFRSDLFHRFLDHAEVLNSVAFVQDLAPLDQLLARGVLAPDAMVVNGQSGDYITGNHIPKALAGPIEKTDAASLAGLAMSAMVGKHYRLWDALVTPENDRRIAEMLGRQLAEENLPEPTLATAHAAHELLELENRQSKYTIAGQRSYELMGLSWWMPLWDREYMDYWQPVSRRLKAGQNLYARMLEAEDWGGVWREVPINPAVRMPLYVRGARGLAKLAFAFSPEASWRAFDRRAFYYWYGATSSYARFPYARVARDRRGARNAVSWHTEAWLAGHGLDFAGTPMTKG